MSAAPSPAKKTVYIDADEEITGIIDKVRSADEDIIALVLPKRATVLQSIVNMKLLKRAADQGNKKAVLITSEAALMPLAGAAGLFVASNLQSRPYIPSSPSDAGKAAAASGLGEAAESESKSEKAEKSLPVTNLMENEGRKSKNDPIEIDNTPKDEDLKAAGAAAAATTAAKKAKKDKAKRVPNFQKFRVLLFAGGALLLLLILFGYYAFAIAPKATVTLRTESSEAQSNADFKADTSADSLDLEKEIVPAKQAESKKTESEKVATTGEKDNGTKASGQVSLRNCSDDKVNIPAGTGISNGGFTFITQEAVQLQDGNFDSNDNCKTNGNHTGSVNVVAQKNGDQYNLSPRSYTISGYSSVLAQGGQMGGGTSKIVKIVSAADVENAKKRISDKQSAVVEELKNKLKEDGYVGLVDTFSNGNPSLASSPAVGAEATEVTVSGDVTYTMLGVKEDDLKAILKDQAKDKVDTTKQSILDYGLDEASYEVGAKKGEQTEVTVRTTLVAGPEIDQGALKKELAGKKKGDAETLLKARPGITDATVQLKPFWVGKVPGKEAKVTFNIEQADGKQITP